jgi:hypothetical protein
MSVIDVLNWRYATKRMNGNIILKEKLQQKNFEFENDINEPGTAFKALFKDNVK